MWRGPSLVLALAALVAGGATSASAAPPQEVNGTIQVTSFTPMPETRRVTGGVVHFEFAITGLVTGDLNATTEEHFTCIRVLEQDEIRCNGHVESTSLTGSGRSESHVRLICDGQLFRCEATTHFRGVDDTGAPVRGKGEISAVGGIGTYTARLTHG